MNNTKIGYESFHGSAKKVANIIANKLNINAVNIDTPFELEDLTTTKYLILVFNFRGPYTAQLTKLYLGRIKEQLKNVNVILIGEGLFSEQEFPKVAESIHSSIECKSFKTYFVKGQLRVSTLSSEEQALLSKFSEITKIVIKDMGELDEKRANEISNELFDIITSDKEIKEENNTDIKGKTKWVCPICGYVHYGTTPPEVCPLCGASGNMFKKEN